MASSNTYQVLSSLNTAGIYAGITINPGVNEITADDIEILNGNDLFVTHKNNGFLKVIEVYAEAEVDPVVVAKAKAKTAANGDS